MEEDGAHLIGATLGSYRLVEHLGSGGMAAVYLARHVETNAEYALKILRGELGAGLDRFGREAVALSRLRHPNVVAVVDFGVTDDRIPFLVMEHVRGPTLAELIVREAPMPLARAARFTRDIASALDEAHALGFVHRDVKSTNVMIHRDERGRETVKLLDFGMVGLSQSSISNQITIAGMIMGTPRYMAPEQCSGEATSFHTDLYALGLVLYEMITGVSPFIASSASAVMIMQVKQEPPLLPPCGGLEDLVAWLLKKDPAARPATVEVVLGELDRLLPTLPDAPAQVAAPPPRDGDDGDDTRPVPILRRDSIRDTFVPATEARTMPDLPTDSIPGVGPRSSPRTTPRSIWFVAIAIGALLLAAIALLLRSA